MMTPANELKHRYKEDPQFKRLVDMFVAHMLQVQVQPYEVRDAAFVAELIYREHIVQPMVIERHIYDSKVRGG